MNLEQDLTFAKVVSEQIDDYVHAEVLFYPVRSISGMQMSPLTIGTWLETEWRLSAIRNADNAPRIDPVLEAARAQVREVRSRTPDLYQTKARREFKSRLDSWTMFLDDLADSFRESSKAIYASNVHSRFKLELLKDDLSQLDDADSFRQLVRLQNADQQLSANFHPGQFVWEPELETAAPKDKYWFLYGDG